MSDWSTADEAKSEYLDITENGEEKYSSKDIYPFIKFINSTLNNTMHCSAMITTAAGYPGKWIPIPCDTNITCSFFCFSEDTSLGNRTRSFDWFTDVSNQSDTGKAGITIKYQTNSSSVLFCPPLAILIENTCFTFATSSRRNNGSTFKRVCRERNAILLQMSWSDYYDSKITVYYEGIINVTYKPLYLKEGIEKLLYEGLYSEYDEYDDMYDPPNTYSIWDGPYKGRLLAYERDYGHALFVLYADKTLSYLLSFISLRFKTYFSNDSSPSIPLLVIDPGDDDICLLLHPDYLKEMPIFHTSDGFSVQGWRLQKVKCSSEHFVDLIVCTVEPSYRDVGVCSVNYYQCQDRSCILSIYVCDGHLDCDSDEQQIECNQTVTLPTVNCPNSDFWLGNNHSISAHSVCDGISQCGDEEDEFICLYFNTYKTIWQYESQKNFQFEPKELFSNSTIGFPTEHCRLVRGAYHSDNSQLLHCRHVLCPGMFKCRHSYCIDIVAICDGVVDCPESEDESSCLNIYCPGMTKCRGETKCVPTWNICDGRSDCLLNQDDEAACYKCPEYCKCYSYYTECILYEIIPWRIKNVPIKIMIAILTKNTFDFVFVEHYLNLLYLDISKNNVRYLIDSSTEQSQYLTYKLFVFNASRNFLSDMYVMNKTYFRFIQVIDLSWNKLSRFVNIPAKLKLLYLQNNLIVFIWFKHLPNKHNLRFLDLRNNPVRAIHLANILTIMTNLRYLRSPDQILCCILPINLKCAHHNMYCKGLWSSKLNRMLFLSINVVYLLLSVAVTIRCIITLYRNKERDNKYLVLITHVSLSDTVLCIWAILTCGLFMVTSPSDRNLWRLSALCNNLGVASLIALQMRMYIQLYHKMFLFVKIVFPLRTNNILTNNTNKMCLLLWLFSVLTSVSLQIIVGKVYIHGDLCFSLFAKDAVWSISSWASLSYWVICCLCVVMYIVLVSIMCRAIFKSSETLQDEIISTKRRKSAIQFSLVNISLYSWWLVFSSLAFIGQTITVRSLYQDVFVQSVIVHNILHLVVTGRN